jgi:acyl dehydratase
VIPGARGEAPARQDARLYWEDFRVGEAVGFGRARASAADIAAFAREFDPAPAHLDEASGGLVASDWHACAMLMRMMCDDYLCAAAGAGAPGVEHVKWLGWVRPGDELRVRRTPLETRASRSRPRIGIVRMLLEVFNQRDEAVLSWLPVQLFDRRDPDAAPPPPAKIATDDAARPPPRPPAAPGPGAPGWGAFEDIAIGEEARLGDHGFSRDAMLGFARRFNPQYFHADETAAAASLYGGLIASGWHTASVWNRLFVAQRTRRPAASAGRGAAIGPTIAVLDMKWPAPVRPGDTVSYAMRVCGKSECDAYPGFGVLRSHHRGVNQRGETVLSLMHETWAERRGRAG